MKIRKARVSDARRMVDINRTTIRKVNSKDYPARTIEKWTSLFSTKRMRRSTEKKDRKYFVVEHNGRVIGFVQINLELRIIKAIYVDYRFIGRGAGRTLLAKGEAELKKIGVKTSIIHSTITAIPFYKSQGYKFTGWSNSEVNGAKIKDAVMKKKLI